jgi:fucose 4-O-acetylase-like acetyltransferase
MPHASPRRFDLDALRVFACYLLIPFHAAMVFSAAPFFHVRNNEFSTPLMIFCGFVSLWHMPLLFLLAGWSAFASYRARGSAAFLRERVRRLVVPLVAGCVLLAPGIKYAELRSGLDLNFHGLRAAEALQEGFRTAIPQGLPVAEPFDQGFLEFLPTFYTQLDRFTWSHLWFLAYLLAFSVLILPLLGLLARGTRAPSRVSRAFVYAPLVPLVAIQLLLRQHWPGPYNLVADWANVSYFMVFLLSGIAMARVPAFETALVGERYRALGISGASLALLLAVVLGAATSPTLVLTGAAVAGWCCIVAILGFVHVHAPRGGPLLDALAESALPVYLLHQPVIVLLGFGIVRLPLGVASKFSLLLVGSSLVTLALYFVARRFTITRFLLGMRPIAHHSLGSVRERPRTLAAEA